MRPNTLAEKLRGGQMILGLGLMYPAPSIIESMCKGWDFAWIDTQHGQFSYDTTLHGVQVAAACGIDSIVRVTGHEASTLGRFADINPSAIMVPMVNSAEEARAIVRGLRFPPLGMRSYGGRRVIDVDGREFYRERELVSILQIETREGLAAAEAIAETEGVDVLFFGPDDMKIQLGIPVNASITDTPEVRTAMEATARAARKAGKFAGCVAAAGPVIRMAADMGYTLVVGGGDVGFLRTAAPAKLEELKQALASATVPSLGKQGKAGIY